MPNTTWLAALVMAILLGSPQLNEAQTPVAVKDAVQFHAAWACAGAVSPGCFWLMTACIAQRSRTGSGTMRKPQS